MSDLESEVMPISLMAYKLVGPVGFEPTSVRLKGVALPVELRTHMFGGAG